MRVKLTLAYDGSGFKGSQVQSHTAQTVMGVLGVTLKRLGIDSTPIASGRTDAGVHATGQVVHMDLPAHWDDTTKLARELTRQLPAAIKIRSIHPAAADFHARFSATRRSYRYLMKPGPSDPFHANYVTFTGPLELDRLNRAMHCFKGEHDFEYFMKTGSDVTHFVRTMYRAFAYTHRGYTVLYFEANGFLRSQIRLMAAAALLVNDGVLTLRQLQEQVQCRVRHTTQLAPAAGLYLAKIKYSAAEIAHQSHSVSDPSALTQGSLS